MNRLLQLLNLRVLTAVFAVLLIGSCTVEDASNNGEAALVETKVDSLLAIMTLEEKIGQMSQVRHFWDIDTGDVRRKFIGSVIHTDGPVPGEDAAGWQARFRELQEEALSTRLGIPLLFGVDAIHGQNTYDGATIFPHNIGMGATANPDLVKEAAEITATEIRATGLNWTFAPCIAIPYNERWGRVYEGFSESTDLTVELTRASVAGLQGDLKGNTNVLATAKHYIADGSTDFGHEGGESTVSNEEIINRLLPPYIEAVENNIGAIMVGFNYFEGRPIHAHKRLITDVLKDSLGFKGMVISDWKGYSRFGQDTIINAGVDMVMAVDGDLDLFQNDLKKSVEDGRVPEARIDDAVRRILRQKFRLNLFVNPFPDASLIEKIGSTEHRDVARQAVRESLVLLKNGNSTLPISESAEKIVVVGEHANNTGLQSGGWTISWQGRRESYVGGTTILDGIKRKTQGEVIYDSLASEGIEADIAIVVVGETPYAEFVGDIRDEQSQYQLTLTDEHQRYIEEYRNKADQLVVILVSGRPLVVTEQLKSADAFVAAWLPGSEGDGIAEVIFGEYNFKGRLPHSWPASVSDYEGKYGPNFWDPSIEPLFEFGYGLKY